jgi:hypothetical protein
MIKSHLEAIAGKVEILRTVDGNGNALGEDKAVSALEGRDLAELVKLQVLLRDTVGGDSLDELEVEVVLLCYDTEASSPGVTL